MLEEPAPPVLLYAESPISPPDLPLGDLDLEPGEAHSKAEVRQAIEALGSPGGEVTPVAASPAWRRLRTSALGSRFRYVLDDPAYDHEDLLQEAFRRLLAGDRTWRRKIRFEYQVARIMDSIASDWRRRAEGRPEVCEARLVLPDDGFEDDDASSVLERPPPGPTFEDRLVLREALRKTVRRVAKRPEDDPEAVAVMECFRLGLSRQEMEEWTQMSKTRLAAAIRRVRRRAKQ